MKREDLFACFDKASEVFAQQAVNRMPPVDEEEEELENRMQEEELARLVAAELGIKLEETQEEAQSEE